MAPNGFPTCLNFLCSDEWSFSCCESDVLRRKSCVIAIPILAKASEVRSHARNVRSTSCHVSLSCYEGDNTHRVLVYIQSSLERHDEGFEWANPFKHTKGKMIPGSTASVLQLDVSNTADKIAPPLVDSICSSRLIPFG